MRMPLIPILILLGCLNGCGSKLGVADVAGHYKATFSYGVETLFLKADGTYEQTFTYSDGRKFYNGGTWKFSPVAGNDIRFNDALIFDDEFGEAETTVQKGDWIMPARSDFFTGSISLIFNDDLGIAFEKVD